MCACVHSGMGEVPWLTGVANKYGIQADIQALKARFFELYISTYAKPDANIGARGAALPRCCTALPPAVVAKRRGACWQARGELLQCPIEMMCA